MTEPKLKWLLSASWLFTLRVMKYFTSSKQDVAYQGNNLAINSWVVMVLF